MQLVAAVQIALLLIICMATPLSVVLHLRQYFRDRTAPPMSYPTREEMLSVSASEAVATHIATGDKISAVAAYRAETGTRGLAEAKRAIDELLTRAQRGHS